MSELPNNAQLLQDYVRYLRFERGLSENTVLAYHSDLEQFAEILALSGRNVSLLSADRHDVAHCIQHLAQHGIGKRSIARKIAALRRFYRWLVLNERLEIDPTIHTVLPKLDKLLPHPIEEGAMRGLLDRMQVRATADDATIYEIRDYAIAELLYGSGLRVSELCGMRGADIMREARTTRVRGKGGKERVVPLTPRSLTAIDNYVGPPRSTFLKFGKGTAKALFLSEQGTGITSRRVHQIIRRVGGEGVHPHRFRHSCCTDMLRNGADLRAVQEMAGHANLGTTQIYTKVTPDHLQDAHRQFHPRG